MKYIYIYILYESHVSREVPDSFLNDKNQKDS